MSEGIDFWAFQVRNDGIGVSRDYIVKADLNPYTYDGHPGFVYHASPDAELAEIASCIVDAVYTSSDSLVATRTALKTLMEALHGSEVVTVGKETVLYWPGMQWDL